MKNISFDQLVEEYGKEDVEEVTDLIADVLTSSLPTVQIGREKVPRAMFIWGGSKGIWLPPFQEHNADGVGCQGRRSRSLYP